jgi:uncharacterized GH25 family protein
MGHTHSSSLIARCAARPLRNAALAVVAVACAWALPAAAHDFWIQPETFRVAPGAAVPLVLQVGHGKDRERSAMPRSRILRLDALGPGRRRTDLREGLHPGARHGDATARFDTPGVHVVALATDEGAISRLPAAKFNAYLAEEGLTPAATVRKRTGRTQAEGVERYGRRTKTLVQVGTPDRKPQPHVTRPVGLTLELVPEANPYAVPRPAHLPVRVYYQGRPLAGALVKRIDLDNDATPAQALRTDASGRVRFPLPAKGRWLLAVAWTRPLLGDRQADFETVFSSLSFGFPASAPKRP